MVAEKNSKEKFPLVAKVINGTIAGIVGITASFPLDLVKTRLQNQKIGPDGEKPYKSIIDCFKKIIKTEGIIGMYRGLPITVAMATPEKMFKLTSNDLFRYYLTKPDGSLSVPRQMLAGAMTGFFQMFLTSPLELIKINMQISALNTDQTKKATGRNVISGIFRETGLTGIYRGLLPTALRDIPFSMFYFPLFAFLYELGPRDKDGRIPSWCSLGAGFASGAFSALAVTPMDVVKTRIQASVKHTDTGVVCKGWFDCVAETYQKEGIKAFFKGGLCRMMVLAPLFGVAQAFYFLGIGEKVVAFFHES